MSKRRVLVVDDEPYVTAMLSRKLTAVGFEVIVASDGEEAYQIACGEPLSMIITDYQMPVMSGYELAVKLKVNSKTAEIPLLMLTARSHQLSAQELMLTNIQHLMDKPFSARDLARKVAEIATAFEVSTTTAPEK